MSAHERKAVDKCADYFLARRKYLRYDDNLRRGLPIATGVIAGTCRNLINDHLDITGARGGLAGAEAVLELRSSRSSGELDEYWEFHKASQLERNHLSRYVDRKLPIAA